MLRLLVLLSLFATTIASDSLAQDEADRWNVTLHGGLAAAEEGLFTSIQFGWWRRLDEAGWMAGLHYARFRGTEPVAEVVSVDVYEDAFTMQLSLRRRWVAGRWMPLASAAGGIAGGTWGDGIVGSVDVGAAYRVTSSVFGTAELSARRAPDSWVGGLVIGALLTF